ncbi:hypothetical protein Esti_004518 [Eimeria stiedai]
MEGKQKGGRKRGRNGSQGSGIMSKRRQLDVGRSCKGVILTCNRQPLEACNEFLNILERFLDDSCAASSSSVSVKESELCVADDVAAGISAELQSMTGRAKRFQVYSQLLPTDLFDLRTAHVYALLVHLCHSTVSLAVKFKKATVLLVHLPPSGSRAGFVGSVSYACTHACRWYLPSCFPVNFQGVAFIRFIREEDVPSVVCHGLLRRILDNPGLYSCRHASRLLPVDVCASPCLPDFVAAARRLCAQALPLSAAALGLGRAEAAAEGAEACAAKTDETRQASSPQSAEAADSTETESPESEAPSASKSSNSGSNSSSNSSSSSEGPAVGEGSRETWACAFSSRGFGTVVKEQVIEALAKLVGNKYKVDITHATHTLLVEVNPYFFGVSLVPDYGAFYRYNLHRCCHPEEEGEKDKPAGKPQTLTSPQSSTDPKP